MTKGKFELKPCPFCGSKNMSTCIEVETREVKQ